MDDITNNFKQIVINGIKTNYKIDKYGTVINIKNNKKLKPKIVKKHKKERAGYSLKINEKTMYITRARLLALTFLPLPDGFSSYDEVHADHIDANSSNDCLDNIQWLTPEENYKKSYTIDGNLFIGEKNGNSKLKESIVNDIVNDLLKGKSAKELSKKYNVKASAITDIKLGRTWRYITKDYDLDSLITRRSNINKYDDGFKDRIKNIIKENTAITTREVCDMIGIDYVSASQNNNIRCLIQNLKNKVRIEGSTTIENEEDNYYTIDINL